MSVKGTRWTLPKLNDSEFGKLSNLGWSFCMVGPNEWTWLKFTFDGQKVLAHGGDDTWAKDVKAVRNYD